MCMCFSLVKYLNTQIHNSNNIIPEGILMAICSLESNCGNGNGIMGRSANKLNNIFRLVIYNIFFIIIILQLLAVR